MLLLLVISLLIQITGKAQCQYATPGLYSVTLPAGGPFQISTITQGADGGIAGGNGARVEATFTLQSGDQLTFIVGQVGQINADYSSGGGGGSAIVLTRNNTRELLVAAGAGGGGSTFTNLLGGGGQGLGPSTGGIGGTADPNNDYQGGSGGGGGLGSAGGAGTGTGPRGDGGAQASLTAISPGGQPIGGGAAGGMGFGGGGAVGATSQSRGGGGAATAVAEAAIPKVEVAELGKGGTLLSVF
ncbi:hypothetical protein [Adhaeribacter arboris]|uniref:hypothetical protein n=1 Tax=Adhaeribacter arboris TaxID=2072846 RepID=UPI0011B29DF2|nr:hypothetical protein [Adhaeribacter arboris]